jgi:RNA polymerase sigma-70 factor (ECF subfamily)
MTADRDTGADVAHEAFLRAFREWSRVSSLDRPGAWVRRAAINLATDVQRRRRRERRALTRVQARSRPDSAVGVDETFWALVRRLPESQRVATVLRYAGDFSVEQIADVMQVSEGAVRAALFKARRSLAADLGLKEVDDGIGG